MIVTRTTSPRLASALLIMSMSACSNASDHPPPSGDSSGTGIVGPSAGSGGDGGAGTDAGADGGSALSCEGATQQGDSVTELRIAGGAPAALGGTIIPGTYVLVEADDYGSASADAGADGGETSSGGASGISARVTLDVTATSLRMFGSRGPSASLPADAATGFDFTVSGTNLETTTTCPTAGARRTIPFSALGGGLALFIDATHRELYAPK